MIHYLIEARRRLLFCLIVITVVFAGLLFFSSELLHFLAQPLLQQLPDNATMIATAVTSTITAPLKLCFILSLLITIPVILYHIWAFVTPGLYSKERRYIAPLFFSSVGLFYLGIAFAYTVVFPLLFAFLVKLTPQNVTIMPDIYSYLNLAFKLFFAFGFCFEVPIVTFVLVHSGLLTRQQLQQQRPYILIGAFVIGMLLTPPDVVSQILLALPLYGLFEVGLFATRFARLRSE
jgi:sec-independent protein translocase protein TatC